MGKQPYYNFGIKVKAILKAAAVRLQNKFEFLNLRRRRYHATATVSA
jgi:hypothetical protein